MKKRLLTAVSLFAAFTSFAQSVTYTEVFEGANPDAATSFNSVGWQGYGTDGTNSVTYNASVTRGPNGPIAGFSSAQRNKYLFHLGSFNRGRNLWVATDFAVTEFSDITTMSFSMDSEGTAANNSVQVAVQAGGTWYVSEDSFFADKTDDYSTVFNLDFRVAAWDSLNFNTLEVSPIVSKPMGLVSRVGFYSDRVGGSVRIDNVSVVDIPEVSFFALTAAAGVLPLLRRRR